MEGVEVRDIELLACRSDKHFDEIWVRVAALASDRMVDAEGATVSTLRAARSSRRSGVLRRPGAKPSKAPGSWKEAARAAERLCRSSTRHGAAHARPG